MGFKYQLARWVLAPLTRGYLRMKVEGVKNVPKTGGLLVIMNHSSHLDPMLVGCSLRRPLVFFARAELFETPVLGPTIRALGTLPVTRGEGDRKAIAKALEILRSGQALAIFPEGTRSFDGQLQEGKPGAAMLALRAKVPVIAAYIDGAHEAWPRGAKLPRPKKVRVKWGKPKTCEELLAQVNTGEKPTRALAAAFMQELQRVAES